MILESGGGYRCHIGDCIHCDVERVEDD
jgi:hypothetical protein